MTPQTELEIKGSFFAHPFAELLAEVAHSRLNGSLRVSDGERKFVIYFKGGRVVFGVSNARSARQFDILLRRGRIKNEDLAPIPDFTDDLALAAYLQDHKIISKSECSRLIEEQIEAILVDALAWPAGEWTFSSLARIRDGLDYKVGTTTLLIDFGRCMDVEKMLGRFRSLDESFSAADTPATDIGLRPEEAFVLSRADDGELTAASLVSVSAMSEAAALQAIYVLWLGGLLIRNDWQPAFSRTSVAAMRSAKLELKTEARHREGTVVAAIEGEARLETPMPAPAPPEITITLDEYLARVEGSGTHYEILGVDTKADKDELKRAYFSLAKMFHPDRYHAEGGDTLRRVQTAFTQLAQAHETLKTAETRDVYDYRIRKELAELKKRQEAGNSEKHNVLLDQAAENFDQGFSLLMDKSAASALPYLARSVHFAPKNARYHAYYGKALADDEKQRHKAEAEMQTALKIEPNNPTYRILLAEFFIQYNLLRRAEGEVNRLLAIFPTNRESPRLAQ
jgi:curved DNA-binding protein CbpA